MNPVATPSWVLALVVTLGLIAAALFILVGFGMQDNLYALKGPSDLPPVSAPAPPETLQGMAAVPPVALGAIADEMPETLYPALPGSSAREWIDAEEAAAEQ